MKKFDVPGEDHGTIEIARAVGKPNIPHLNRFVSNFIRSIVSLFNIFTVFQTTGYGA